MTNEDKKPYLWQKVVVNGLIFGCVFVLIYQIYLDEYYHLYGAKQPQPEEGKVFERYFHHGTLVFITQWEKIKCDTLLPCLFILQGLAVFLLDERWKVFKPQIEIKFGLLDYFPPKSKKKN